MNTTHNPNMTQHTLPTPISANNSPFAAFTFAKRIPFIFNQIKSNNALTPAQADELSRLLTEIQTGTATPQQKDFLPADWPFWEKFVREFTGLTYAEIPFFEAEAYLYYRIMRIMDYPNTGTDPFATLKTAGLGDNIAFLDAFAQKHLSEREALSEAYFTLLLYNTLWANSADLSQLDANDVLRDTSLRGRLVIDDTRDFHAQISAPSTTTVDYIVDNAGIELIADLFLADYLLHTDQVQEIILHVKQYPIFVSDATATDVSGHLEMMRSASSDAVSGFAKAIQSWLDEGRLRVRSHPFWNSPMHFTELPDDLKQGFAKGTLLLFKGDANYRRLFEDRAWPATTPIRDVLHYLAHPCASIRTLKSEIVLGLSEGQAKRLDAEDPNWLTNGRYGLIMVATAHSLSVQKAGRP